MCCEVAKAIAALDVLMIQPPDALSNEHVKAQLKKSSIPFSTLLENGAKVAAVLVEVKKLTKKKGVLAITAD